MTAIRYRLDKELEYYDRSARDRTAVDHSPLSRYVGGTVGLDFLRERRCWMSDAAKAYTAHG